MPTPVIAAPRPASVAPVGEVEAPWVARAKLPAVDDAPVWLQAEVPVVGLRVPVPAGRGLPPCDLYFEADTIEDGAYWVARDIRRIVVAGETCPPMVIYDHHLPDLRPKLEGGRMAKPGGPPIPAGEDPLLDRMDVDFDGQPELRIPDQHWWGDWAYFAAAPGGDGFVHVRALDRKGDVAPDLERHTLKTWRKYSPSAWDVGWYTWEGDELRARQVARLTENGAESVNDPNAPHRLDVIRPTRIGYRTVFAGPTRAKHPEEVHLMPSGETGVPSLPSAFRVPLPEALGIPGCELYIDAEVAENEERWTVQDIRRVAMAGTGCDTRVIFDSGHFFLTLDGGVVAKPGGAPLTEGEAPLLELVDVTFDGVPELRINGSSGRQQRGAFFRVHPDGRSLLHLAAMLYLPNARPDPASRTIETWSAPSMAQHDTSAFAWRDGRLVRVRHAYTLHELRPDGGEAPPDHVWQTEVALRAGRYEVVRDAQVPTPVDPP